MVPTYIECSQAYRNASDAEREANCNGCGTDKSKLVPDTIYGLSIRPACCPHDDDYKNGKTAMDKINADFRFLRNMFAIIDNAAGWHNKLLRMPRRRRALKYFEAVNAFGHSAFWAGKTNPADPTVHIG